MESRMHNNNTPTLYVGLGTSAGGLSALDAFFTAMPSDSGMAFFVIQHLSPDHKSELDVLLAKRTGMRVCFAEHGQYVEANQVYLLPPGQKMLLSQERIALHPLEEDDPDAYNTIDYFLNSLANEAHERAVAIILSGTGSDGASGGISVNGVSGYVMAQSIASAEYGGMPQAMQDTGVCDAVASAEMMPKLLLEYYSQQILPAEERLLNLDDSRIQKLATAIQQAYSIDFSKYKEATILRRLARRMEKNNIKDLQDYFKLIGEDRLELDALYADLLIGVTEFFRDPATFAYLESGVIPKLFQEASEDGVRVWVAGCSTGEEAYSLAIALLEQAQLLDYRGRITVFATDAYPTSLASASVGLYKLDKLKNLSEERLAKYFVAEGNEEFRVTKELRSLVVFAPHNLLSDPPFTRIDLVSCRNLLIYLKADAHAHAVALLNFALRPNGILFLGSSEGLGRLANTFSTLNSSHKIYRKIKEARHLLEFSGVRSTVPFHMPAQMWQSSARKSVPLDRQILHDYDVLLKNHLPPSILIDETGQVLHYFGDVAKYLRQPEGRAETNILRLVKDELHVAVSLALQRAKSSQATVRIPRARTQDSPNFNMDTDVVVDVLIDQKSPAPHYHIMFTSTEASFEKCELVVDESDVNPIPELKSRLFELENELILSQQNLQVMVDEAQNSREELLAANEEMQSANEELQSTNEELRSVNEEISTVNAESEKKNRELQQLNQDHTQLLGNLDVGVLFLDENLRIRKFNRASAALFRLLPQDIGRPIEHLTYYLADASTFETDLNIVLERGKPIEREVRTKEGAWYLKRFSPYRDEQNITGVVVSFTDVTQLKALKDRAELYLDTAEVMLVALDNEARITMINRKGCELLGYREEELLGKAWFETCVPQFARTLALDSFQKALSGEIEPSSYFEDQIVARNGETKHIAWHRNLLKDEHGAVVGTLSSGEDTTAKKQAQDALVESEHRFRTIFEKAAVGVALIDSTTGEFIRINQCYCDIIGYQISEIQSSKTFQAITHPGDLEEELLNMKYLLAGDIDEFSMEKRYLHKDGEIVWVNLIVSPVLQADSATPMHIAVVEDISERKKNDAALLESEAMFRTLTELSPTGIYLTDVDGACTYVNNKWCEMAGLQQSEVLGVGWINGLHPKDRQRVADSWQSMVESLGEWGVEYRFVNKSGKVSWVYGVATPFYDSNHQVKGYMGVNVDVTQKKEAEHQVHTLSQAMEQSPVLVMITKVDGQIEYVNQAFEDITGYCLADVQGKTPRVLKSGLTPESHFKEMWATLKAGKPWFGELQNRRKSGEMYWERAHIAPVLDETGEAVHFLAVKEDITNQKKQEERILYQAHYDALTELPNRFLALDRLTQLIKDAGREGSQLAVLFLDLDDFKKINDTMGHDVGDKLLLQAASRLRSAVPDFDTVARLGGDEFIVLLNRINNAADAQPVAQALLEKFQAPFCHDGREFVLTASLGISIYPGDGDSAAKLLRNADTAMYHSKEHGRNTFHYYKESMNRDVSRRLALEGQLRTALDRGELYLCYQPLVDISDRRLIGVEALLRWNNSELGMVTPDEFIPVAEQTGLIVPMGQYVLAEAIKRLGEWSVIKKRPLKMAVNLSPRQLKDTQLIPSIRRLLKECDVTANNLELEITEGVLMEGKSFVDAALGDIGKMGIGIAMDDFGTGYSSLSYLRNYPFHTLKIDRSFVNDIITDPADRELINAIIAMAHGLGLKVVAEGVENQEQLDYLTGHGCDIAQGYYLGKPMSWDEIMQLDEIIGEACSTT